MDMTTELISAAVGAAVGAAGALGVVYLTQHLIRRREHRNWLRDRQFEAAVELFSLFEPMIHFSARLEDDKARTGDWDQSLLKAREERNRVLAATRLELDRIKLRLAALAETLRLLTPRRVENLLDELLAALRDENHQQIEATQNQLRMKLHQLVKRP